MSEDLPLLAGVAVGGGPADVDRFASSSVLGGVETGVVGGLLTIGLLPAQPVIAIKKTKGPPKKIRRLENTKFAGKCGGTSSSHRTSHLKRIPIKRIPSTNRFPSWRAAFPAIPRPLSVFQKLLEEKPLSVFPSPAQLPLRRTSASASILHPAVGQFPEICPYFSSPNSRFGLNFKVRDTISRNSNRS